MNLGKSYYISVTNSNIQYAPVELVVDNTDNLLTLFQCFLMLCNTYFSSPLELENVLLTRSIRVVNTANKSILNTCTGTNIGNPATNRQVQNGHLNYVNVHVDLHILNSMPKDSPVIFQLWFL